MTSWTVGITSRCWPAAVDGQFLLPVGAATVKGHRVLVEADGKGVLMKVGHRSDSGQAAGVSGSALGTLGGEGAQVDFRQISLAGVLTRDRWLGLQFVASLLTVLGAIITAYLTYIKNTTDDSGAVARNTAFVALAIASVIAVAKFFKDYRDL